jgi:hypothetical protein
LRDDGILEKRIENCEAYGGVVCGWEVHMGVQALLQRVCIFAICPRSSGIGWRFLLPIGNISTRGSKLRHTW